MENTADKDKEQQEGFRQKYPSVRELFQNYD